MKIIIWCSFIFLIILIGCHTSSTADELIKKEKNQSEKVIDSIDKRIHTIPSLQEYQYKDFNSPKAINRLAEIENEYFDNCNSSISRYHGTVWGDQAKTALGKSELSLFDQYKKELQNKNEEPYPLDCTLYSIEGLKAGMDDKFKEMHKFHKEIWNKGGFAGWSVGYILVEEFDWEAFLIVSQQSKEYESCIKNFKKDKNYHVWKQPNIPITEVFDFDHDQERIDSLLSQHEFGWGFSEQGWHTWITRFTNLKECNWMGSPSDIYQDGNSTPLFITTKFTDYYDYDSHIIIFPRKKATFQTQ